MTMSVEDKGSKSSTTTATSTPNNNNNNNNNNNSKHHRMIHSGENSPNEHYSQHHLETAKWQCANSSILPPPPIHPPSNLHGRWDEGPPAYSALVKVEPPTSVSGGCGSLGSNGQPLPPPSTTPNGTPVPLVATAGCTGPVSAISTECTSCGEVITDRFILQVANRSWHANCLRCTICYSLLDNHASCFLREEQLFCKMDYTKLFGAKCFKCERMISPTDWVRKAREQSSKQVYHLACFACDACKRQLSTGEEFGIHENRVLCKAHYMEILDGGCSSSDENGETESHSKKKTKRMRTTFTEEQIQILQANFQIDSNPDGQDLERIAQITGLSKRVTQVWFQNCRARQKKYLQAGKGSRHGGSSAGGAGKMGTTSISGHSPGSRSGSEHMGGPGSGPQGQHQVDLHVMYSAFKSEYHTPSIDSNSDNEMSQDSFILP